MKNYDGNAKKAASALIINFLAETGNSDKAKEYALSAAIIIKDILEYEVREPIEYLEDIIKNLKSYNTLNKF